MIKIDATQFCSEITIHKKKHSLFVFSLLFLLLTADVLRATHMQSAIDAIPVVLELIFHMHKFSTNHIHTKFFNAPNIN